MDAGILLPGLLFLLTLATGVWLSRSGRPLNTLIFTFHKLIALAAVILTGVAIYDLLPRAAVQSLTLILIVAAGLCVLTLFISGAFLSREKPVNKPLLTLHWIMPLFTVLSAAGAVYLLAGGK